MLEVVLGQSRVSARRYHPQARGRGGPTRDLTHGGPARDDLGQAAAVPGQAEQFGCDAVTERGADQDRLGVGTGQAGGEVGRDQAHPRARNGAGHKHDVASVAE